MPSLLAPLTRPFRRAFAALTRRSGIDAGSAGSRWGSRTALRAPAREVLATRALSVARSRWFVVNTPEGAAMASAFASNLVADGPSLRPVVSEKSVRAFLVAAFGEFWDRADAEGQLDLGGILARVAWLLFVDGEAFVHFQADRDTGELRLKILSPEQFTGKPDVRLEDGGWIVGNIEFGPDGRRSAYWLRANLDMPLTIDFDHRRIPAEDIVHLFEPRFAGQVRGVPMLAASATILADTGKLRDALLAKANTAALFGMIFYKPDDGSGAGLPGQTPTGDYEMEPGATIMAPPGYSVEAVEPPAMDGAIDFLRSNIRAIAAGAGIPYELVSGDLSQVNYSSARLGLLEFRRRMTVLQKTLITGRMLQPLWRRWCLLEGLAGRMGMAEALTVKAEFVFPGWAQVDPLKETNADIQAINAGLKSRFEVISARGRDPEAVAAEIAQDPPRAAKTEVLA